MEILLWLVPPVLVTVVAMLWVSWLGRAGRGVVDRDEAVRRMGAALEREPRVTHPVAPRRARERSTGVAVRRAPRREDAVVPDAGDDAQKRRAS